MKTTTNPTETAPLAITPHLYLDGSRARHEFERAGVRYFIEFARASVPEGRDTAVEMHVVTVRHLDAVLCYVQVARVTHAADGGAGVPLAWVWLSAEDAARIVEVLPAGTVAAYRREREAAWNRGTRT